MYWIYKDRQTKTSIYYWIHSQVIRVVYKLIATWTKDTNFDEVKFFLCFASCSNNFSSSSIRRKRRMLPRVVASISKTSDAVLFWSIWRLQKLWWISTAVAVVIVITNFCFLLTYPAFYSWSVIKRLAKKWSKTKFVYSTPVVFLIKYLWIKTVSLSLHIIVWYIIVNDGSKKSNEVQNYVQRQK